MPIKLAPLTPPVDPTLISPLPAQPEPTAALKLDDSPRPIEKATTPQEPEADSRTLKERLDDALRASGVDVDAVPPPSGKYILSITLGSVTASVTPDLARLSFEASVSKGPYARRRIPVRFVTRATDLLKYDLAVKQGVAGLFAWANAAGLDPERDIPPHDPGDPEKALRAIGVALWSKRRGLTLEVEIEVNAKGFINVKNVRRVE